MKKGFVLTALYFTALSHAMEGDIIQHGDSHLSLGTEHFCIRSREKAFPYSSSVNAYFAGVNFKYEYLEPKTFYAGFDGQYCLGSLVGTSSRIFPGKISYVRNKLGMVHKELEGRLGYNVQMGDDFLVSPYIGVGRRTVRMKNVSKSNPERIRTGCTYLATGFRSEYSLSETVTFGVNFKRFYAMAGEVVSNTPHLYLTPINYGHEISFPWEVTFNGSGESFEVRLEPYFRKDNANSDELTIGTSLQISCDF